MLLHSHASVLCIQTKCFGKSPVLLAANRACRISATKSAKITKHAKFAKFAKQNKATKPNSQERTPGLYIYYIYI